MAGVARRDRGRLAVARDGATLVLRAEGAWDITTIETLDRAARAVSPDGSGAARIDLGGIERLDTAGAWLLHRTREALRRGGLAVEFDRADPDHAALIARVAESAAPGEIERKTPPAFVALLAQIGRAVFEARDEAASLLNFLGLVTLTTARTLARPARLRLTSLTSHLERAGFDAMPIVGLLAFLIGVVISYQGADQLRRFGAEIFTVNLLAVSILREMGILLTAIVLAGRTGSAFTAQIGTMQVNEEIDAMRTIGVDPVEVLVLPRVFALIIALPLLTVYADLMGLAGGALMSLLALDISLVQFLERLKSAVSDWTYWIGLIKAPIFGATIAMVGCRHGLRVEGSAESVGRETTRSVVVSIFLVIVLDAAFSIMFSYLKI